MININKANKAFMEYVKSYDMSNSMIKSKYEHTFRVCNQSKAISESINLDEENTNLAYLIALLHDIGRFEQAKVYNTFNDSKSVDHADYGCKILFEDGLIRNFIEDDRYDEIIYEAILFHNKYSICPAEEDELKILHSKIIRDADKIDIMHNACNLNGIKINEDENGISEKVTEDFELLVPVSHSHKSKVNDSVLTMIAFVFDLNFLYSYRYFRDNEFINKMYNKLKNKKLFKPYIEKANGFVEGKCKNVGCKVLTQRGRRKEI